MASQAVLVAQLLKAIQDTGGQKGKAKPGKAKPYEVKLRNSGLHADEAVVVVYVNDTVLVTRTRRKTDDNRRDLALRLTGAVAAVAGILEQRSEPSPPPLSLAESELLDSAGLPELDPDQPNPLDSARIELGMLIAESLLLDDAAKSLHVSSSRLRQRLTARTLYGIKEDGAWRLPRFQFQGRGKLLRNIDKVLPSVRPGAHPLAVARWFQLPHQDLVAPAGGPVSPRAWLAAGWPPQEVADLASEI